MNRRKQQQGGCSSKRIRSVTLVRLDGAFCAPLVTVPVAHLEGESRLAESSVPAGLRHALRFQGARSSCHIVTHRNALFIDLGSDIGEIAQHTTANKVSFGETLPRLSLIPGCVIHWDLHSGSCQGRRRRRHLRSASSLVRLLCCDVANTYARVTIPMTYVFVIERTMRWKMPQVCGQRLPRSKDTTTARLRALHLRGRVIFEFRPRQFQTQPWTCLESLPAAVRSGRPERCRRTESSLWPSTTLRLCWRPAVRVLAQLRQSSGSVVHFRTPGYDGLCCSACSFRQNAVALRPATCTARGRLGLCLEVLLRVYSTGHRLKQKEYMS